jgi:hypothetical protein
MWSIKSPEKTQPEQFWFERVWKGKKPNRTKPKLVNLNRFSVRFGLKTWKKNWFGCLFWSKTRPDQKCSTLVANKNLIAWCYTKKKNNQIYILICCLGHFSLVWNLKAKTHNIEHTAWEFLSKNSDISWKRK